MRTGKSRLRPVAADAVNPHARQGPKTLKNMRPIRASRSVLEVFSSAELEAVQRPDGEVRLVKAGRRKAAGAREAPQRRAVVKMVPSGKHFIAVPEVPDPARGR